MKSSTAPLLSSIVFAIVVGCLGDATQGQILNRLHPVKNNNQLIQYSPDDPTTRGRLFALQTGHAGAFYNCDGEECKRQSPWICWKNGPCKDIHRPIWDITQWKRDRAEIAQRICDGGCCCEGGNCATQPQPIQVQEACGCSACVAKANSSKQHSRQTEIIPSQTKRVAAKAKSLIPNANKLVQALNKVGIKSKANRKSSKPNLRPRTQIAGLMSSLPTKPDVLPAQVATPAPTNTSIAKVDRTAVPSQPNKVCDCAACRVKRANMAQTASKPNSAEPTGAAAPKRTATLVERARELQRR